MNTQYNEGTHNVTPRELIEITAEWRSNASCAQTDPDEFFPSSYSRDAVKLAKTVCASCIVRDKCLTEALENNEIDGIWGGTTPHERRWLASRRPGRLLRTSPQSRP